MIIKILKSMKNPRNHKKGSVRNKHATSEISNTLEGINHRLDEAEDRISDLEDKVGKNTQVKQQKEKIILKK